MIISTDRLIAVGKRRDTGKPPVASTSKQRGQLLAARIHKDRDQPCCRTVGYEHDPWPLRHIRRLRSMQARMNACRAETRRHIAVSERCFGIGRKPG